MLGLIFTEDAKKNILTTGNVWGHTIEYDFNFKIRIWRRVFHFEQRSSKQMWGRFGGGWSVKLGLQAVSFKRLLLLDSVIISLFTMSVHIKKVT